MTEFCKSCNNLLQPSYMGDELSYICSACNNKRYRSNPKDSLRFERYKDANVMIFEKILNNASRDPATSKEEIKCIDANCPGDLATKVIVGNEMRAFYVCITCNTKWLY